MVTPAGRSVRDIIADLDIELRDTSGSQNIWTFNEKYRAIQEGFRRGRGFFRIPDVYSSLRLAAGQREYALPNYVRNVRGVDVDNLAVIPGNSSSLIEWRPLRNWHMLPSAETNRLWIENDYPGANVRVYYENELIVPPVEASLWSNVTSTQTYIPVANTNTFKRYEWPQPGYVVINQEVIRYEIVTATSFTGLTRGMYNTGPRASSLGAVMDSMARGLGFAHQSNVAVTPWVALPGGSLDQYLNDVARQQLYLYRMNDADTESSRNAAALSQEFGRQADEQRKQQRSFHWPRAAQQRFPRRS